MHQFVPLPVPAAIIAELREHAASVGGMEVCGYLIAEPETGRVVEYGPRRNVRDHIRSKHEGSTRGQPEPPRSAEMSGL